MGSFKTEPHVHYIKEDENGYHYAVVDVDTWLYFEAVGMTKDDLGYKNGNFKLWWKENGVDFQEGWKEIYNDMEALNLSNYAANIGLVVHIYVQHLPPTHGGQDVVSIVVNSIDGFIRSEPDFVAKPIENGGFKEIKKHASEEESLCASDVEKEAEDNNRVSWRIPV
ncbi:hypothetical protein JHK82_042353 [Glycine max]|nr:hypothetical protein JHK86_042395 [Glycine max]KAG5105383.1 hypothetical protein JHK82_042353 [Glycine max]KAG5116510.1 hypothetical protein JHK84_042623 [Glycine max]